MGKTKFQEAEWRAIKEMLEWSKKILPSVTLTDIRTSNACGKIGYSLKLL